MKPSFFCRITLLVFLCLAATLYATLEPERLRTEYLVNPIGIDAAQPRLSWSVTSPDRGATQSAYRIAVSRSESEARAGRGDLWDSGRVASDATNAIVYGGPALRSNERVWWAVRIWDATGEASGWSEPAFWETGLLAPADWHGHWIARAPSSAKTLARDHPQPLLRRVFTLDGTVRRARLYLAGLGYHEISLNARKVGDEQLQPGFTRYDQRVLYVAHDVTDALLPGENVLGVMLGNGWLNVHEKAAWRFDEAPWRATPRLLLELRVEFDDGRTLTVASDEQWRTADGPITFAGLYGGENYDARREQPGWDACGFDDSHWQPALGVDAPRGRLEAQAMHPVRVVNVRRPIAVGEPVPGVFVFDVGQNLTGNAELILAAPAGTQLTMRYGERLDATGRLDQSIIALHVVRFDSTQQFQADSYTFKGAGTERWHSRFTYHGFRYVEVTGAPAELTADSLAIRVLHADMPVAGHFEAANPVLNRIWENGRWSYLGNFFAFPTDCPHREKNGWTGDALIACEQGLFYQDGITLYEKWIQDISEEQFITGALPGIVPTSGQWGYGFGSGPAWDSAFLWVPWYLYQYYGDSTALRRNFAGFKKYVDYLTSRAHDNIVEIGLGDWSPWKARTPVAITDTAYYYRDARIVAAVARMLGGTADAEKYDALADQIRAAFNREFYHADTATYATGTQTALGAALFHGLAEPGEEERIVDSLLAAIARNDHHLDYGYLGSKWVPNALAAHGRAEVAYRMNLQPTEPSYAAQVAQGATTLWENWDSGGTPGRRDGAGSLNHTFFGDVNAWMMKYLAGIAPDPHAPGFRNVIIAPQPPPDLEWARGSYDSVRGLFESEWHRRADGSFELRVTVPANCTATILLPVASDARITEGGRPAVGAPGVSSVAVDAGRPRVEVGSGEYRFVAH